MTKPCPHCRTPLRVDHCISGDEVLCVCGARVAVWHQVGGRTDLELVRAPVPVRAIPQMPKIFVARPDDGRKN